MEAPRVGDCPPSRSCDPEEVEAARGVLGGAVTAGFYSHGGIAPFTTAARCELHNQTMTITTLAER